MFNIESFDIKLNTDYLGRNFIYADEMSSTNTYLMDKENKQTVHGSVVLAEKQTKGKGRKDRVWYSAPDTNLTFSILLTKDKACLLYTSPSPRDRTRSRMPSSAWKKKKQTYLSTNNDNV